MAAMDERQPTEQEAESINEQMAASMAARRRAQPERRQAGSATPRTERRRVCGYCYQPGDHPTPAHCMRALERP
jgi:hypothetical protein